MKKIFLLLTMVFLSTSIFAAGQQEEKEDGPITLTVWDFKYGEAEGAGPVMKEIDDLFMAKNPGIIIEHVAQPSADAYYNLIRTAAAINSGPDIFMTHGGGPSWELSEIQVKLDDYIAPWRDQITEDSWNYAATDNNLVNGIRQVPLTAQGMGIYYNKELFIKAGLNPENPPTEWNDFKAACEALVAADITPLKLPNSPSISTEWLQRALSLNFYNTQDAKSFADGSIQFTDPDMKVVVSYLKEIMDSNWIGREDKSQHMFKEGIPAFKAGEAAMTVGLLSDIACWKDYSDALGKENVGFFPNINLPGNKYDNSLVFGPVGIGYSVANWSKNIEAAVKYLEFYSTGNGAQIFASKLGALVPSPSLDLSTLGYSAFADIQKYFKNANDDYFTTISKTGTDINQYQELFYNLDEITIDEYLANIQKSINENYIK